MTNQQSADPVDTADHPGGLLAAGGTGACLREPRPGDGWQLARYADQATHGRLAAPWLKDFAGIAESTINEPSDFNLSSRRTGRKSKAVTAPYMRVLDLGQTAPSGMIYSVQPMYWIIEQSRAPLETMALIAARMVEINLLAVHSRHRRSGHATAMLADTEAHYRAAGFTLAMVMVDDEADPALRGWYERRGYTFCERGERPLIQMRRADRSPRAFYSHMDDTQIAGFKPLGGSVTVGRCEVPGLLTPAHKRPVDLDVLLVRGVIDP